MIYNSCAECPYMGVDAGEKPFYFCRKADGELTLNPAHVKKKVNSSCPLPQHVVIYPKR